MTFVWQWPQIAILVLFGLALLLNAAYDGKPRKSTDTYRFSHAVIKVLVWGIVLYFGGFFTVVRP